MEELIPTLQEEGEERIDTIAEQTIIAGVQTINGKAGDLNLKTINNTDLLTTGNLSLATPTDLSTAVSTHNTSATAHTDIRQAITSEATARENADTALNNAKQDKLVAGANIQIAADGKTISATDTTYSAGSGLNLTGTTFSVDTDTIATQNDIYTLQTTKQDNLTTPQLNAVNSGIDSTKVAQIATNEGDIATINGKIPTQASTSNQLADKNFVNSSVQTATANYRGSWDDWASVPTQASDYPEDYAGSHTPTVNDYMVVQDASDYTEETLEGTWRFKYTGEWDTNGKAGWLPEYQVNETPLTAAQIAAINSGITDTLVAQISTNQSDISNLNTNKLDKTTTFWGQTAQNGAVQGTLTLTESGQNATIATSGHNTTDAGIKMGNSKNYVEAGVTEITLSSTTGGIKLKPKSGSSVDVMSSKITNLATPTANTDASTKKYVDDGLATKQNTLTAGANITITGDEISATDTTYSAGTNVQITGTTISATDTTYSAGTGLTLTGTTFSVNDPAPSGFFTGNATTESEGTAITLTNALGTTIKNVELEGDTSQTTLSGKNLFDRANATEDSILTWAGGVDYANTGSISSDYISATEGVFATNYMCIPFFYNSSKTYLGHLNADGTTIGTGPGANVGFNTFTIPSGQSIAYMRLMYRASSVGNPSDMTDKDIMFNTGSSVLDYEPYCGGTASPNPDFPQAVNVVTGRQTVKIVPEQKNIADPQTFIDWVYRTDGVCVKNGWGSSSSRPAYGEYYDRSHVVKFPSDLLYSVRAKMVDPTYDEARLVYQDIFKENTAYTISMDIVCTSQAGYVNMTVLYTDGTTKAFTSTGTQDTWTPLTLTTDANKTIKGIRTTYASGTNFIDLDTFQIEEGTTKTAYTPFVGQSYDINLGKNLFNESDVTISNGYVRDSQAQFVVATGNKNRTIIMKCLPNTTYTISKTGGDRFNVFTANQIYSSGTSDISNLIRGTLQVDTQPASQTIATGSDTYLYIHICSNYETYDIDEIMATLQVEYGNEPTTYSAYFTPIELCKIGTYQDYIYKANGNWYKHAEVGKIVYNGSESWNIFANHNAFWISRSDAYVPSTSALAKNTAKSDYYSEESYNDMSSASVDYGVGLYVSSNPSQSRIVVRNKNLADVTALTTWLSTHNTTVYYALATATDTQITNADLITQLEALVSAQLATGINYINSSGVRPNLDAILTIEAFNNNWNGLSQALLGA